MFFKPAIIALIAGSLIVSAMLLYASWFGLQILRNWDIKSGSELQLNLERRTYLISSLMAYAFGFQLLSFFLFLATADQLHPYFTGAMCAAGSLYADRWGYPTAVFKVVNFLLAGTWLIVNYADDTGYDYPLIKTKYFLLLAISPLMLAETVIQAGYFSGLKPEIITSCCGSLFTTGGPGILSEVASLPPKPMEIAFGVSITCHLSLGLLFYRNGTGGYLFSGVSLITFLVSIAAVISFISIYAYELPTHHCPFCILQREYGYIGYPLYLFLFGGALTGMGIGALSPFKSVASLKESLPTILKRLAFFSLLFYSAFTLLVIYVVVFSNLKT
jgi:hypothetical protein